MITWLKTKLLWSLCFSVIPFLWIGPVVVPVRLGSPLSSCFSGANVDAFRTSSPEIGVVDGDVTVEDNGPSPVDVRYCSRSALDDRDRGWTVSRKYHLREGKETKAKVRQLCVLAVSRLFSKYTDKQLENLKDIPRSDRPQCHWSDKLLLTSWKRHVILFHENTKRITLLLS